MPCCDCCCPEGEECCKAPGENGICCDPERCCGTEETPACCDEGEFCCEETCCPDEHYCCDGVCQEEPCEEECETDEDCGTCPEGTTPLAAPDGTIFCCDFAQAGPEQEPTETECGIRYLPVGDLPPFGVTCQAEVYGCPDPDDNTIEPVPSAAKIEGYCCDGECQEEPCAEALMVRKGPGTILKELLARFGIKATAKCQCAKMARKMDQWGQESLQHIEEIADVMEATAKARKLPFSRVAAKTLIRIACWRANKR